MMIVEFIQYLRYEKNYSTHTVCAYKNDLDQFFEFAGFDELKDHPASINSGLIREWMIQLLDQKLKPRSVNRKISSLKTYWHFLQRQNVVSGNPFKKIVSPKASRPLPVFLKDSEMETLLAPLEEGEECFTIVRDHLILDLFYSTGIRLSELIGLTDTSVDLSAGWLKVTGKRNKQRLIPFGEELKKAISYYLAVRNEQIGSSVPRFFVKNDGASMYPQMVYRMVKSGLSQVSTLSKNSPHVLRHTFATSMLNGGAELNAVKDLLGHSSLSATEVYTHTSFAEMKKVYKQAHPRA